MEDEISYISYPEYIEFTIYLNQNQIVYKSEKIPVILCDQVNYLIKNTFYFCFVPQSVIIAKYIEISFINKICYF